MEYVKVFDERRGKARAEQVTGGTKVDRGGGSYGRCARSHPPRRFRRPAHRPAAASLVTPACARGSNPPRRRALPPPPPLTPRPTHCRRGICFDFQKGLCNRGEMCRFSHDISGQGGYGGGGGGYGGQGYGGGGYGPQYGMQYQMQPAYAMQQQQPYPVFCGGQGYGGGGYGPQYAMQYGGGGSYPAQAQCCYGGSPAQARDHGGCTPHPRLPRPASDPAPLPSRLRRRRTAPSRSRTPPQLPPATSGRRPPPRRRTRRSLRRRRRPATATAGRRAAGRRAGRRRRGRRRAGRRRAGGISCRRRTACRKAEGGQGVVVGQGGREAGGPGRGCMIGIGAWRMIVDMRSEDVAQVGAPPLKVIKPHFASTRLADAAACFNLHSTASSASQPASFFFRSA